MQLGHAPHLVHGGQSRAVLQVRRVLAVAMQVEGDSLLIGRHMHHSAFSLADIPSSQSDEEEVGQ
jgi:hypothetical protein